LDAIKLYKVKAVFFVNGINITDERRSIIRRIADEGHTLGTHTWDHMDFINVTNREIVDQLTRTSRLIYDITGRIFLKNTFSGCFKMINAFLVLKITLLARKNEFLGLKIAFLGRKICFQAENFCFF
jgi:hypothetical protein